MIAETNDPAADTGPMTPIERVRCALGMLDGGATWQVEPEDVEELLRAYDAAIESAPAEPASPPAAPAAKHRIELLPRSLEFDNEYMPETRFVAASPPAAVKAEIAADKMVEVQVDEIERLRARVAELTTSGNALANRTLSYVGRVDDPKLDADVELRQLSLGWLALASTERSHG